MTRSTEIVFFRGDNQFLCQVTKISKIDYKQILFPKKEKKKTNPIKSSELCWFSYEDEKRHPSPLFTWATERKQRDLRSVQVLNI